MFNRYKDVLTVKELCEALNIGRNSAYALLRSGEIRSIRIGRSIKIPKTFLIEYITRK